MEESGEGTKEGKGAPKKATASKAHVDEVSFERPYFIPDKQSALSENPQSQPATDQAKMDVDSEFDDLSEDGMYDPLPKNHFLYWGGHVSEIARIGNFCEFMEVPDNYKISVKGCARYWLM